MPLERRDHDVWRAIVAALQDTDAFREVLLDELPSGTGQLGADRVPFAIVTPTGGQQADPWDDEADVEIRVDGTFTITVVHRDNDPAQRFAALDRLLQVASNAIDGQCLAELTIPGLTRLRSWTYPSPEHPEKHLVVRGEYAYLVPGVAGRNEEDDDDGW